MRDRGYCKVPIGYNWPDKNSYPPESPSTTFLFWIPELDKHMKNALPFDQIRQCDRALPVNRAQRVYLSRESAERTSVYLAYPASLHSEIETTQMHLAPHDYQRMRG